MRYRDNIDYLVAAIAYLGTHTYFWARTPEHMARELSLDEAKLHAVFDSFPGIFRKSADPSPHSKKGQHFYSLQARYAQREGPSTGEPEQVSYIAPLPVERMSQVVDFVLHAAQMETQNTTAWRANWIAAGAAILSAATAIAVVVLKS